MAYDFPWPTLKIDENRHYDKNIYCKIKWQRAMEQVLGYNFLRTGPDEKDVHIFIGINEIFRRIKLSNKKTLIKKISTRLLETGFKWDNKIKSKGMKYITKRLLSDYK